MNKCLLIIILLVMPYKSLAKDASNNIIIPVSYFVDHIKQLNTLKSHLNKYKTASIVGTSGIGKTQLVRIYAYDNKDKYKFIWFFDCNLDLNKEFLKLSKYLNKHYDAGISEEAELSKKEAMQYLAERSNWLLVFDNLKINENNKVPDVINWEHNGNVVFASQDSENLPYTISISPFGKDDAVTLAKNLLDNANSEDIEFLSSAFNGYPILIVQGAQLLNKVKGLSREEYKKKVYQSADKIKLNIELAIKELSPSAANLLGKISLLNNQAFSKNLLKTITDFPDNVEDDIFQLSKFMLISNIEATEQNPLFEMHDIIAQKILEINAGTNNELLEDIIKKINNSTQGAGTQMGHIMRTETTVPENLEIILRNADKYQVDIYSVMELRKNLLVVYVNTQNKYGCEQLIKWFEEQDNKDLFNLLLMDNKQKGNYAAYLGLIGVYNQIISSDYYKAINFFDKALNILRELKDRINLKYNLTSHIGECMAFIGEVDKSQTALEEMEKLFQNGVDKEDITLLFYANSVFNLTKGDYIKALECADKDKKYSIKYGLSPNDLFMTVTYISRMEALNWLGKYDEAYDQAKQLYDMHKPVKRKDHKIFGKIYAQMAKSKLGQNKIIEALDYISKAIIIFAPDDLNKLEKNVRSFEDPDLASGYLIQGDIYYKQNKPKEAIEAYKKAQAIYSYLYKSNRKNVHHVSYLYTQGAKASCEIKDKYNYKSFGKAQIEDFGIKHQNTIEMLEYCKRYDMDIWAK